MKRRLLGWLLICAMVLSYLPSGTMAQVTDFISTSSSEEENVEEKAELATANDLPEKQLEWLFDDISSEVDCEDDLAELATVSNLPKEEAELATASNLLTNYECSFVPGDVIVVFNQSNDVTTSTTKRAMNSVQKARAIENFVTAVDVDFKVDKVEKIFDSSESGIENDTYKISLDEKTEQAVLDAIEIL